MYFLVFLNFRLLVSLFLSIFNLAAFLPYLCKILIFVQNEILKSRRKIGDIHRSATSSLSATIHCWKSLQVIKIQKKGFKNPNRATPQVMRCNLMIIDLQSRLTASLHHLPNKRRIPPKKNFKKYWISFPFRGKPRYYTLTVYFNHYSDIRIHAA